MTASSASHSHFVSGVVAACACVCIGLAAQSTSADGLLGLRLPTFAVLPDGTVLAESPLRTVTLVGPFVAKGNIYSTDPSKKTIQLTFSGADRAPILSPDGKCLIFIRKSENQAYLSVGAEEDYHGDEILADQIWTVDLSTGKERLLVADRLPGKGDITKELQRTIAHIDANSLCFSPDGTELYFISSAWVVSGALHAVNVRSGRERFIDDANSVEVVQSGKYAGHLIVNQHRYFLGTGSFDWYWLIDPKGRDIGPVGERYDQVETFKEIYN